MTNLKGLPMLLLVMITLVKGNSQTTGLNLGDELPDFSILDDTGKSWNSKKQSEEQFLVVYFYPAALTGGCTKQACAYRDDKENFDALAVKVVGISGDEVKNLQYFKQAYNLNFSLLSDSSGSVAKSFGVPTKDGEKSLKRELDGIEVFLKRSTTTARWTFVFDTHGVLIYKNNAVKAGTDSSEVKKIIKAHKKA